MCGHRLACLLHGIGFEPHDRQERLALPPIKGQWLELPGLVVAVDCADCPPQFTGFGVVGRKACVMSVIWRLR